MSRQWGAVWPREAHSPRGRQWDVVHSTCCLRKTSQRHSRRAVANVLLLAAHNTALQSLPWKSFSSGRGRQGRQRVVRHPVSDSPLESASIGKQSGPFTFEAGRAGSTQYPVTLPPVEYFFFSGWQARQAARSTEKFFFFGRQAGQAAHSKASC